MSFNFQLTTPPTDPLRPINPGNAWGLCITAPAGTELGTPYSSGTLNVRITLFVIIQKSKFKTQNYGVAPAGATIYIILSLKPF